MSEFKVRKKEAAEFFGVSVQALDGWFTRGAPIAAKDSNGRIQWLELAALARWRIDQQADSELEVERTRLTKAQADKTELEVHELNATLIPQEMIEAHWTAMVASMRARLLVIPARLAPQIAGRGQVASVQNAIREMIYEALHEIAGDAFPDEVRKRMDRSAKRRADSEGAEPEEGGDAKAARPRRRALSKARGA